MWWSGSARRFLLTWLQTDSILVYYGCYRMGLEAVATEAPPCKANKPKCSVRRQSGRLWGPWTPPAIPGGIASWCYYRSRQDDAPKSWRPFNAVACETAGCGAGP